MPYYDYYCKNCDRVYEVDQRISEVREIRCRNCGEMTIRRWDVKGLINMPTISKNREDVEDG